MGWFVEAIVAGITSFVATNIDDIVVLMLFFAQVNARFRPRQIVLGQYLGFLILIAASLPGFFGGLLIPKEWLGLLGLLPIVIGISHWMNREQDETEIQTVPESTYAKSRLPLVSTLTRFVSPQTYQVAAVTIANGGDNIGIYVPLFAHTNLAGLGVIIGIFFALVGVWCYIAYLLASHRMVAAVLTRYSHMIVPFVLIGLGVFILIDSETYRLLPKI